MAPMSGKLNSISTVFQQLLKKIVLRPCFSTASQQRLNSISTCVCVCLFVFVCLFVCGPGWRGAAERSGSPCRKAAGFVVFLFGSFFLCVSSFSLSVSLSFLFLFQGTPPSDVTNGEGARLGPLPPTLRTGRGQDRHTVARPSAKWVSIRFVWHADA